MAKDGEQKARASQSEKFIKTAREIGCDESEDAFKERLRKLVSAPPAKAPSKPKAASHSKDSK